MFGDCQLFSSMGMGGNNNNNNNVSSDTLYSSSIQNPNFNFMTMGGNNLPFNIFPPNNIIPVSIFFLYIF